MKPIPGECCQVTWPSHKLDHPARQAELMKNHKTSMRGLLQHTVICLEDRGCKWRPRAIGEDLSCLDRDIRYIRYYDIIRYYSNSIRNGREDTALLRILSVPILLPTHYCIHL